MTIPGQPVMREFPKIGLPPIIQSLTICVLKQTETHGDLGHPIFGNRHFQETVESMGISIGSIETSGLQVRI